MNLPLYSSVREQSPRNTPNAGLLHDKFFDQYQSDWGTKEEGEKEAGKQRWLVQMAGERRGVGQQLEAYRGRMVDLLARHDQEPLPYKLGSDFVTGLGRKHPVENGFVWHATLGTAYLPGSSVKGIVRAWAEQWEGIDKAELKRIFGSEGKQDAGFRVGSVTFLDAVPASPVRLKVDIMTPHFSPYYGDQNGDTPPADWHSPIPIPFLVVAEGATFVFGIMPRKLEDAPDCEKAWKWLKEALEWTGAGAKTAAGYGRFALDSSVQEKWRKERERQRAGERAREEEERQQREIENRTRGKSEIYRELYETSVEGNWREDKGKGAFSQAGLIEGWLDRLESDPQPDAIFYLREFIDLHFKGLLQNPEATKGKKKKPAFNPRQRGFAGRMNKLLEGTE